MYELAEKIKLARERKGLSQIQLAKRIEISPPMISSYESGAKAPSTETLIKISDVLGVSLDYLAGLDKKETVIIEDFSTKQKKIIISLCDEFTRSSHYKGLNKTQSQILSNIFEEFAKLNCS